MPKVFLPLFFCSDGLSDPSTLRSLFPAKSVDFTGVLRLCSP